VDALARASATVRNQPDPLRAAHLAHAQVPAEVGRVLRRAMSQNAALRHSSAAEMRAALRQAALSAPQNPLVAGAALAAEKSKATSFEATVVEARAHTPAAQHHAAQRPAQPRPAAATPPASMRGVESPRRGVPQPEDSYTALARRGGPAQSGVSPTRIVGGLVAVLLFSCAAAGSYLLIRPSAASPAASGAKADMRTGPQADPQAATPAAIGTTVDGASAGSSPRTPADTQGPSAFSSSQPSNARAADEPRPSAQQSGTGAAAEALGAADANSLRSASVAAPSEADRTANAARPALVIQNPAPAPRPSEGAGPDDPRRAGEFQNRQPEFRPEDGRRPPPPDGRRPPPPDGRPYPPPPRHRPPPYR
jgi:hypothetical protein